MSTIQFIDQNGQRFEINPDKIITERRCDLCGMFAGNDALTLSISAYRANGMVVGSMLSLDVHPARLSQIGSQVVNTWAGRYATAEALR